MREESLAVDAPGLRLDQFLARKLPGFSRSHLKDLIKRGSVTVSGALRQPSHRVERGDHVRVRWPAGDWADAPFESWVLHEDADLLVLCKPAGILMHPMGGSWETRPEAALNEAEPSIAALMIKHRPQAMAEVSRCGLVHRLDRQTSGVLLVAKSGPAQKKLLDAFRERRVHKVYRAVVLGEVRKTTVDAPIGRQPGTRKIQVTPWGRAASTEFSCVESAAGLSLVQAEPKTGRTHQIRAHLALLKLPVLGDPEWFREPERLRLKALRMPEPPRMLLHAYKITFKHPKSGREVSFTAPLPQDFRSYWQTVLKSRR